MFTQIAGFDPAGLLDFHRRDISPDRADVVGNRFRQQRTGLIGGAYDRGVGQVRRPAVPGGAIDHHTVPRAIGGHHRRSGNPDFFLFERRGHSAASSSSEITWLRFEWRHGAEWATTSPMMRMGGPPSIFSISPGR